MRVDIFFTFLMSLVMALHFTSAVPLVPVYQVFEDFESSLKCSTNFEVVEASTDSCNELSNGRPDFLGLDYIRANATGPDPFLLCASDLNGDYKLSFYAASETDNSGSGTCSSETYSVPNLRAAALESGAFSTLTYFDMPSDDAQWKYYKFDGSGRSDASPGTLLQLNRNGTLIGVDNLQVVCKRFPDEGLAGETSVETSAWSGSNPDYSVTLAQKSSDFTASPSSCLDVTSDTELMRLASDGSTQRSVEFKPSTPWDATNGGTIEFSLWLSQNSDCEYDGVLCDCERSGSNVTVWINQLSSNGHTSQNTNKDLAATFDVDNACCPLAYYGVDASGEKFYREPIFSNDDGADELIICEARGYEDNCDSGDRPATKETGKGVQIRSRRAYSDPGGQFDDCQSDATKTYDRNKGFELAGTPGMSLNGYIVEILFQLGFPTENTWNLTSVPITDLRSNPYTDASTTAPAADDYWDNSAQYNGPGVYWMDSITLGSDAVLNAGSGQDASANDKIGFLTVQHLFNQEACFMFAGMKHRASNSNAPVWECDRNDVGGDGAFPWDFSHCMAMIMLFEPNHNRLVHRVTVSRKVDGATFDSVTNEPFLGTNSVACSEDDATGCDDRWTTLLGAHTCENCLQDSKHLLTNWAPPRSPVNTDFLGTYGIVDDTGSGLDSPCLNGDWLDRKNPRGSQHNMEVIRGNLFPSDVDLVASNSGQVVVPATTYLSRNEDSTEAQDFANCTNFQLKSCCPLEADQPVRFQMREGDTGDWETIEVYDSSLASSSFESYRVPIPERYQVTDLELRWVQDAANHLEDGVSTWAVDSIALVDHTPVAGAAGFALSVSDDTSSATMQDSALTAISGSAAATLTVGFWLHRTGDLQSDILVSDNIAFHLQDGNIQVEVGGVSQVSTSIGSASTWIYVVLRAPDVNGKYELCTFQNPEAVVVKACAQSTANVTDGVLERASVPARQQLIFSKTVTDETVYIDHVRVWKSVMDDEYVEATFGRPWLFDEEKTDLVAEWPLDEGACGRLSNADSKLSGNVQWVLSTAPIYDHFYVDATLDARILVHFQGQDFETEVDSLTYTLGSGIATDVLEEPLDPTSARDGTNNFFNNNDLLLANPLIYHVGSPGPGVTKVSIPFTATDSQNQVSSASNLVVVVTNEIETTLSLPLAPDEAVRFTEAERSSGSVVVTLSPTSEVTPRADVLPSYIGITNPDTISTPPFDFTVSLDISDVDVFFDYTTTETSGELTGTVSAPGRVSLYLATPRPENDIIAEDIFGSPANRIFFSLKQLAANDYLCGRDESEVVFDSVSGGTGGVPVLLSETFIGFDANATGLLTFEYSLKNKANAEVSSINAVVSFTLVTGSLNPPIAQNISESVDEDVGEAILLQGIPDAGDNIFRVESLPSHGKLYQTDGSSLLGFELIGPTVLITQYVWYEPDADNNLPDSFEFSASDRVSDFSTPATVSITMIPSNDPAVAIDYTETLTEGTLHEFTIAREAMDIDNPVADLFIRIVDYTPRIDTILTYLTPGTVIASVPFNMAQGDTNVSYSPAPDTFGPGYSSFGYQVSDDNTIWSSTGTVTFNVEPSTLAPVPEPDASVTTNEDEQVTVVLVASDKDQPKSELVFVLTSLPTRGQLFDTVAGSNSPSSVDPLAIGEGPTNANGEMVYVPNLNLNGEDPFTFNVSDGTAWAIGNFKVIIVPQPDPPSAGDVFSSAPEGNNQSVTLLSSDPDGLTDFVYTITRLDTIRGSVLQANGTRLPKVPSITIDDGNITYEPEPYFYGTEIFSYFVSDGDRFSNVASVNVTVTFVNDPPVGVDQINITATEDIRRIITIEATDPDIGQSFQFTIAEDVTSGQLYAANPDLSLGTLLNASSLISPNYTLKVTVIYVPNPDFAGYDYFTFTVVDNLNEPSDEPATVSILVDQVSDPPVAIDSFGFVTENVATILDFSDYTEDIDNDESDSPAQMLYTVTGGIPNEKNGLLYSGTTANPANQIISAPVLLNSSQVLFVPTTNLASFNLSDPLAQITWIATEAASPSLQSNEGTLSVIVNNTNQAPTGADLLARIVEDATKTPITISGTDVDLPYGDTLKWIIRTLPDQATIYNPFNNALTENEELTNPVNLVYVSPDNSFTGITYFEYQVQDASDALSPRYNVTLVVGQVNDPPDPNDVAAFGVEETIVNVTLSATDIDTDPSDITFLITSLPTNGDLYFTVPPTLRIDSGDLPANMTQGVETIFYLGFADFAGIDTFTYSAFDGALFSPGSANVTVTLTSTPDPPRPLDQLITDALENVLYEITLTGFDPDPGYVLTYTITSLPGKGKLSENADGSSPIASDSVPQVLGSATVYYTGDIAELGIDRFTFTVEDETSRKANSNATVTIVIAEVNNPPIGDPQGPLNVLENTRIPITLTGTDPESQPLRMFISSIPTLGYLSFEVLGSEIRIQSQALPIELSASNTVNFTSFKNFEGSDFFQFFAWDGVERSPDTNVTINVNPVEEVPFAYNQTVYTYEDEDVVIILQADDPESGALVFDIVSNVTLGSLVLETLPNQYRYTPPSDVFGAAVDSFQFTATDPNNLTSNVATVTISINPQNDRPQAVSFAFNITEDIRFFSDWKRIQVSGSQGADFGNDLRPLRFRITTLPSRGYLSQGNATASFGFVDGTCNGTCTYIDTPGTFVTNIDGYVWFVLPPGEEGTPYTSFEYVAVDAFGATSETAVVPITVIGANVAPICESEDFLTAEDTPRIIRLTPTDANGNDLVVFIQTQTTSGGLLYQTERLSSPECSTANFEDASCWSRGSQISDADSLTGDVAPVSGIINEDADGNWYLWYAPAFRYFGDDTFVYQAYDGAARSLVNVNDLGLVKIEISPVNFKPNCTDFSVTLDENECDSSIVSGTNVTDPCFDQGILLSFNSSSNDIDGEPLVWVVTESPQFGRLFLPNGDAYSVPEFYGSLYYLPNRFYSLSGDRLEFDVREDIGVGSGEKSEPCTVIININPVNSAPEVFATRTSMRESSSRAITLTGQDPDGDTDLTFVITSTRCPGIPGRGSLAQLDGTPILRDNTDVRDTVTNQVVYTPLPGQTGKPWDCFFYAARDEFGALGPSQEVTIDVLKNTPPIALADFVTGFEDIDLVVQLQGSDINGDDLTAFISFLPLFGRLYQAVPSGGGYARGQEVQEPSDVQDPDRHVIFVPGRNEFSQSSGNNLEAYDEFGFRVFDGDDFSRQDAKITVYVEAVQDTPISRNITLNNAPEDDQITIILSGTSPDGTDSTRALKAEVLTLPLHGSLYQNDANLAQPKESSQRLALRNTTSAFLGTPILESDLPALVEDPDNRRKVNYVPDSDYNGEDAFSFRIVDQSRTPLLFSSTSWVGLTVVAVNDPPLARNVSINVVPGTAELLTLQCSDVDEGTDIKDLTFSVENKDDEISAFQADATLENPDEPFVTNDIIEAPPSRDITDVQGRLYVTASTGPATFEMVYECRDPQGASSDPATVFVVASDPPAKNGSGVNVGLVAGVVGGVVVALVIFCIIFVWWYRRRQALKRVNMAEQMGTKDEALQAMERLILHSRDTNYPVVCALSDLTAEESLATSLVTVFVAANQILPVLKVLIQKEVRECKNTATLFRGNSVATKMITTYSKMVGRDYLIRTLQVPIQGVLTSTESFEVDPRKLQPDEDIDANWERLLLTVVSFFEAIIGSADDMPREFREICAFLFEEVTAQFPDFMNAHGIVGGFLFLRFLCPSINVPDRAGLSDGPAPPEKFRCLVLVSKALQNLSNGVTFGSKEQYMARMNDFIVKNLREMKNFLTSLTEISEANQSTPLTFDDSEKKDALHTLHRHLYRNQDDLLTGLQELGGDEGSREWLEHLAALDLVLTYNENMTEDITEVLVSDLPLVFAVAGAAPGQNEEVSRSLITVFEAYGMTLKLLRELVETEIGQARNQNMLLRGNSTALRMVKGYVDQIGVAYLQQVLGTIVKLVVNEPSGYEIAEDRVASVEELETNARHLMDTAEEFIQNIFQNIDSFPIQIRVLCRTIANKVNETSFGDSLMVVLGDFVFSRIICPAIITPMKFGIIEDTPSPQARRALLLITKTIQLLAHSPGHSAGFSGKDKQMVRVQPFVSKHVDSMIEYLETLIDIPENAADDAQLFRIDAQQLKGAVRSVYQHINEHEDGIRQNLTPDLRETGDIVERLRLVLQDLGAPVQIAQ